MAISTKNTKTEEQTTSGGLKPVISPSNETITILSIELKKDKNSERFGDKLVLKVMGPEREGFKGLLINKEKPELGHYKGQTGYVNYSRWGFKNDVTPQGTEVFREEALLKAIKNICDELKISDWFEKASDVYPTIYSEQEEGSPKVEDFIKHFNETAPFKGIYFYACIYGREYTSNSYVNYDMFFPRFDRILGKPFSLHKDKVITFFESAGIERLKDKPTQESKPIEIKKAELPSNDLAKKAADHLQEQSNLDFLASLNEPVPQICHKDNNVSAIVKNGVVSNITITNSGPPSQQPVHPIITSQAEANFMNEGKINTPITDSIMEDNTTDIVTGTSDRMPWD